jgi:hypothetical protein
VSKITNKKEMNTIATHAAQIANSFPGFQSGINAVHRDTSDRRVAILTVFNRVINEDSGLRFRVLLPVSDIDWVDGGGINLLGRSVEKFAIFHEIVITKVIYLLRHAFKTIATNKKSAPCAAVLTSARSSMDSPDTTLIEFPSGALLAPLYGQGRL